ncbi:MAG: hypothetical protein KJ970_15140 [Candidatus Eisenbacteria bacterium]|uniref:Uncharacterized protein n=1 Tax=Eiseniibacteriota bacterium TaxID=2212470 RepID=A0A948RXE9_UNCEI|nr:hypothetical protein [Candidatus Eisenbacteria bacterium]MBU1948363.1 hypothetical protein [Candidatus Eisenbacteria bacterium]MBU2692256.1 hypothetical protein [Candidatus Eisenbacteria bacterium]
MNLTGIENVKFLRLAIILLSLIICSCGDNDGPNAPDDDSQDPGSADSIIRDISDLDLDVMISSEIITQVDTVVINMILSNPTNYSACIDFATTCQEKLWVYDEDGDYLGRPYTCLGLPTTIALGPGKSREYQFEWTPCPNLPGYYTLIAGFHNAGGGHGYTYEPIQIQVIGSDESAAGAWEGSCARVSAIPEWQADRFTMSLTQDSIFVRGTLTAGGATLEGLYGTMRYNKLVLRISFYQYDRVVEFSGDVCGGSVGGVVTVRYIDTGRIIHNPWSAEKVSQ